MNIYITGDTHRKFERVEYLCKINKTSKEDILIILGDAGINFYLDNSDKKLKNKLNALPITLFCIHGNHEARPSTINTYKTKTFHGGQVFYEEAFPSILFAIDGEIFDFNNNKCLVIGGAYSIDKYYRLSRGLAWFSDEQPSQEIKEKVENVVSKEKIDIIFSHTAPLKYEPTECFLPGIDQSTVDKTTETWLDTIEEKVNYKKWYCGHYHINKNIDNIKFMFTSIEYIP